MGKPALVAAIACGLLWLPAISTAQPSPVPTDDAAREDFLRKGRIVQTRSAGKGVTGSTRATLTLGDLTHDVHIQTIDESKWQFKSARGTEFNFRDKWHFNIAAYKLDRLLDLQLVPVTVERRFRGESASFTWWVDDVLMDEGERLEKNVAPPDARCWDDQMQVLGVFDQLIANTDRNVGNVVITKAWRVWAIDHTRAFRSSKVPAKPAKMRRVDRGVLERLAALDFDTLKREVKSYLNDADVRALLSRRDAIVAHFRAGGERVLYDRRDTAATCRATPPPDFQEPPVIKNLRYGQEPRNDSFVPVRPYSWPLAGRWLASMSRTGIRDGRPVVDPQTPAVRTANHANGPAWIPDRRGVAAIGSRLPWLPGVSTAQPPPAPPDDAAMEEFLLKGRIVRTRSAGKGVTGSIRATLTFGDVTHDAHVQTIDQSLREFQSVKGTEFNFRDKWQFNLAAYKLDRLMDLRLVPVTVERRYRGEPASFTWWVDDVLMDEEERIKRKVEPPVPDCWNEQMQQLRMFDQLIENTDRNLGNVVISTNWRLWAIDHTRAFRRSKVPPKPANLTRVDRGLLERLARLEFDTLKRGLKRYLDDYDLRALLSRRDAIVAHFRVRGEQALYDRRDLSSGCHAAATQAW